jgi:hypothetical protein
MSDNELVWKYKEKYGSRAHLFEGECTISICGMMDLDDQCLDLAPGQHPFACAKCRELESSPASKRSRKGSLKAENERLKKVLRQVFLMIPDQSFLWVQKVRKVIQEALDDK